MQDKSSLWMSLFYYWSGSTAVFVLASVVGLWGLLWHVSWRAHRDCLEKLVRWPIRAVWNYSGLFTQPDIQRSTQQLKTRFKNL